MNHLHVYLALAPSTASGVVTAVTGIATTVGFIVTAVVGILQIRKLRREGKTANSKLDVIHELVNSTLTAALESELEAQQQSIAAMTRLIAEQQRNGGTAAPETLAAIEAASVKVGHIQQQLADRLLAAQRVLSIVAAQKVRDEATV